MMEHLCPLYTTTHSLLTEALRIQSLQPRGLRFLRTVIMRLPLSVVSITQNGARLDSIPPSRSVARAVVSEDAGPRQAVDLMARGYQPRSTPRYSQSL